jgi:hypothetical protein
VNQREINGWHNHNIMSAEALQEFVENLYHYEPALVTLVRSFVVARYKRFRIFIAHSACSFALIGSSVGSSIQYMLAVNDNKTE